MNPLRCQSINRKIKFQFEDRVQTKTIPSIQFIEYIRYPGFQVLFDRRWWFQAAISQLKKIWIKNWVYTTNTNFIIPISLQPDEVHLWYFQLSWFDQTKLMFEISKVWNIKGLRLFGWKDTGIIKSEFVAKTRFLSKTFKSTISSTFLF